MASKMAYNLEFTKGVIITRAVTLDFNSDVLSDRIMVYCLKDTATPLTEQQIIDLKDAFAAFDKNNDGLLNFPEVKDMLVSIGRDPRSCRVNEVLKEVDTDGDGAINFAEFLNFIAREQLAEGPEEQSELQQMFAMFDRNRDGRITHAEMKRALAETGQNVPDSEIESMIREADDNCDGKVSYKEFVATMKKKYPGVYD
ncbi:CALM-like protein [Mya arenaria]|uniref:CALM-like protein n=1 Tax=Mya arenaria TaxID=6604 RepID=A0ABY7FAY9_MYAAR|nr:CALM-like protein [Mya arenaria]